MRVRPVMAILVAGLLAWAPAGFADGGFPASPPADPNYASAEVQGCGNGVNGEQHALYSFLPKCAPNARDPENASGMSVDQAWREYTTGSPDVVIAYVEGGINWHNGDAAEL